MSDDFDLFRGIEKFDLILEKIKVDNEEIFNEANVDCINCCKFSSHNNKYTLCEVNSKLPDSIKILIVSKWKEFCENNKG